jgi:hypothetical protein
MPTPPVVLSGEVADALTYGRPVVALESTIISHGLPQPRNLEVARELEGIVREGGAVPATIAVLDGVPRVGLDKDDLERIATEPGLRKLGFRDLAAAAGADVLLSNHTNFDGSKSKIPALRARAPGAPHPYVVGKDAVRRYLTVADECARAGLASTAAATR